MRKMRYFIKLNSLEKVEIKESQFGYRHSQILARTHILHVSGVVHTQYPLLRLLILFVSCGLSENDMHQQSHEVINVDFFFKKTGNGYLPSGKCAYAVYSSALSLFVYA